MTLKSNCKPLLRTFLSTNTDYSLELAMIQIRSAAQDEKWRALTMKRKVCRGSEFDSCQSTLDHELQEIKLDRK